MGVGAGGSRSSSPSSERNQEIKKQRRELPWVPVEKEYEFDTEDGRKSLAELFDGRSQLLAYNISTARTIRWAPPRMHKPRGRVQRPAGPPEPP